MTNYPHWLDEEEVEPIVQTTVVPTPIEEAVQTSLTTDDDSSTRIYINPTDDAGFIRTDDPNINEWFNLYDAEELINHQFGNDEVLPQIAFYPFNENGLQGFRIEAQTPVDDYQDHEVHDAGVISSQNLIDLLQNFVNHGFRVYTDYSSLN